MPLITMWWCIHIDANNNTPAIMSNLVLGWQVLPQLKLHTHILFEGKQTSHNTDLNNVLLYYKEVLRSEYPQPAEYPL